MSDEYQALAIKVTALEKLVDAMLIHSATGALNWPVVTAANFERACAAQQILEPRIEKRLQELLA